MNLNDWRQEYDKYKLNENELSSNPIELFTQWFDQAKKDGHKEPNAMVLSTCGEDCIPQSRMVLLKEIIENKFIFYSNYNSKKGKDLNFNSKASLLFYWENSQRQVRILGNIVKGEKEMSVNYFNSRPFNSQISAISSPQSDEITIEELFSNVKKTIETNEIYCPEYWGAYEFTPFEYEFWQGQPGRLHDRIRYKTNNLHWIKSRLAP